MNAVFLKKIFAVLIIFVFSFQGKCADLTQGNAKPNIIVILVDDLGYGDLSVQGGEDIYTPNIDKLFKKGMHFKNFYANCTVCSPTRASLITGCYPDMVGVPGVIRTHEDNSWGYLKEDVPTLPEMLKKAGYKTAIIGKWHLGLESPNTPNERGFDFFHGFLGDMMDDYWTHLRHGNNYMRLNNQEVDPKGHATDVFSNWAIDYLKNQKENDSPFFLYLAYNAPHFPIQPPEDWFEKVKKREPQLSEKRTKNVAFVEHLDDGIGRVLNTLDELDLSENTLIIFSSDNGGHLPSGASNGSLRGGKQDMYEGGIKVPTCFVWQGKIQSKSESYNLGLTMDILPTLCEIAGATVDTKIDGISLFKSISGEEQDTNSRSVYFMRREGGKYAGMCYYAIRQGSFKLLQNTPFEPLELFNLGTDPAEKSTLNENTEKFNELRYNLSQHIRESGNIPWQKQKK
ncbi:sulfatase-like hydrolase/transferase [Maribellus comscasis]|uniref:Sulfatase-like hydrolase/transferase n=1 Tax=Maribellus comscasis TaxID=2681766 RepID=A0A6I6JV97_9BACT|nr:sulfatase-like hydrolase/transferase [Maribellus comscasis]QGY44082.1 sulfatase-like hydrolase/transferase [Maribellus comscasis]